MLKDITINGVYKHFKGDTYCVVEVSRAKELEELKRLSELGKVRIDEYRALHTEKDLKIYIYKVTDGVDTFYFHNSRLEKENLVIYKCVSNLDKFDVYARPLGMFLSKTDKEKYPYIEQEYRFELLEDPTILFYNVGE